MWRWVLFIGMFILSVFPRKESRWFRIGWLTVGCIQLAKAIEVFVGLTLISELLAIVATVLLYFVSKFLHSAFCKE